MWNESLLASVRMNAAESEWKLTHLKNVQYSIKMINFDYKPPDLALDSNWPYPLIEEELQIYFPAITN